MSDVHLQILRAAAKTRARQLQDDEVRPPEGSDTANKRHVELQRLAVGARRQLARASARRRHDGG
jgi:hypothetical protein